MSIVTEDDVIDASALSFNIRLLNFNIVSIPSPKVNRETKVFSPSCIYNITTYGASVKGFFLFLTSLLSDAHMPVVCFVF